MKKWTLSAVLAAMIFSFTGCGDSSAIKTVDYYESNPDERKAMIEECKNNPGELRGTPNCVNAFAARSSGNRPDLTDNPNMNDFMPGNNK